MFDTINYIIIIICDNMANNLHYLVYKYPT
jgi:hypothetical protein